MESAVTIFQRILDGEDIDLCEVAASSAFNGAGGSELRIASLLALILK